MDKVSFLDELQDRLAALINNTPAADLQKNVKALLTQQFARLELVTREEFDIQTKVLARSREKLDDWSGNNGARAAELSQVKRSRAQGAACKELRVDDSVAEACERSRDLAAGQLHL